jgi:DNA-binding FadR family transcriptional regulator
MSLQPVERRSVPGEVYDQIVANVVHGGFAPGQALPSERRLAEVLGVSRPAVREALQRLAQVGLVEVRQGETTTVRDYRRHAGLDLLPRLLKPGGTVDPAVVRSILEVRLHVGPFVAALAAERSGARLAAALRGAVAVLGSAADPLARQRAALAFWDLVVDGADSIAFRLMYNGLRAAYEPAMEPLATVMDVEVSRHEAYAALAEAITAGNAEGARQVAEDLLRPATTAIMAAINTLPSNTLPSNTLPSNTLPSNTLQEEQ